MLRGRHTATAVSSVYVCIFVVIVVVVEDAFSRQVYLVSVVDA